MKHLVICILSLAALIRHSMYPLYKYKYKYKYKYTYTYTYKYTSKYTRHLMRTVVPRLRRAQWQKGESLLANARIDAFCHEGCNAAHIRTVSFSQWDSHQPHPHPPPCPSPCSPPSPPPSSEPTPQCSSPFSRILLILVFISTLCKSVRLKLLFHGGVPRVADNAQMLPCPSLSPFDENNFTNPRWPSSMNP